MRRTYSHIDLDERRKITRWRMAGLSVEIIAEKLGRHRSTIFREIKRNMFIDAVVPDITGYYCVAAHGMACERRAKLRKLARFSHVRQSVIDRIMHGYVISLVERVSRFAIFLRNNDRQSRPVMDGLVQALQALPHLARRSITFDHTISTNLFASLGLST
ncbi:IS30 family transposase [Mesorhizobium soli]|nr:IS30 family transposase [Mesorhizobium soli]